MAKPMKGGGLLAGVSLALWVALAGCYNTNRIKNGGLLCGTGDSCPDGFVCLHDTQVGQLGHCWKKGTGPSDAGAFLDSGTTCMSGTPPFGPFADCTSVQYPKSTCDPVCQSGCSCGQRCILDTETSGSFVCEAAAPPSGFIPDMSSCNDSNSGRCSPGSLCVTDAVCPSLCERTCRTESDCTSGTRCTANTIKDKLGNPVDNLGLCSPPIETCSPLGAASCATQRTGFACVFLAGMTGTTTDSTTVCHCATQHDKKVGAECNPLPDDCVPGAVCVGSDKHVCRAVCSKSTASSCPNAGTCKTLYGSSQYGYCP